MFFGINSLRRLGDLGSSSATLLHERIAFVCRIILTYETAAARSVVAQKCGFSAHFVIRQGQADPPVILVCTCVHHAQLQRRAFSLVPGCAPVFADVPLGTTTQELLGDFAERLRGECECPLYRMTTSNEVSARSLKPNNIGTVNRMRVPTAVQFGAVAEAC